MRVSDESRVRIINESKVVDFVKAEIGEGCRWREKTRRDM